MRYFLNMILGGWPRLSLVLFRNGLMLVLLTSFGCSVAKRVELPTVEIPRPNERPNLPAPEPIEIRPFNWKVLTEKDKLVKGQAYISLSPKDYENLALTMSDVVRWIKEARWRLKYYKGEELPLTD